MPVGQLLGQQPRRPAKWRAVTRWRDWRISAKLGAVTLVPIVFALILGGITISNQVQRSNNLERVDRLVTLGTDLHILLDALQQERSITASQLTDSTVGNSPALDAARGAVDRALPAFSTDAARAAELDSGVGGPSIAAGNALSRLATVRQQVSNGKLEAVQAMDSYSAMTTAVLALDTSRVASIGDDSIGGTPSALHDLQVAKEEMSSSQSLLGYGISRHNLTSIQLNQLRTDEVRLGDRLDDFRASATPAQQQDFDSTVMGPDYDTRTRLAGSVLNAQGASSNQSLNVISAEQWNAASNSVIGAAEGLTKRLDDQVRTASNALVESSGTNAGLLAVLLFAALIVTAAVVFLITRQILQSLRLLRSGALDVADHQLPAAVRRIQEGEEVASEVHPLAIGTSDEIGEVAQAFDAVHSQALRLAMEQAHMRTGFSHVFVNLSRRSQSLVQRQLQLIERLERDEEDADQLATLFQLDHLATRMRRNNENLMVLSGAEPGRRSGQPVATADVLRAAVSEIEQYQRVVVQQPPDARIVGYAASDLMRLVAELLDNATAFSAPQTQVTVTTHASDNGGLVVEIVDKGIGMNETEVAEANSRLYEAATIDLATSRRMGLFVVGRLANRHNIGVSLHGGKDVVGVRAIVTVPAELVRDLEQAPTPTPAAPAPSRPGPVPHPSFPELEPADSGSLPQRRTVNGVGHGIANLAGTSGTLGDGAATPGGWSQNGHSGVLPSRQAVEVSGPALFTPATSDEPGPPPALPPAPPSSSQPPETPAGGLPAGSALFEANTAGEALTEWWSTATTEPAPPPPPPPNETTPIFDETLSAWFRSDRPARPSQPAEPESEQDEAPAAEQAPDIEAGLAGTIDESEQAAEAGEEPASEPAEQPGWAFASDESWRTVQSVAEAEPSSFTDAGLPRRQRGEQLLPGSAATSAVPAAPAPQTTSGLPVRNPADVRRRLSRFQDGVHRARHAAGEEHQVEQPAPQAQQSPYQQQAAPEQQQAEQYQAAPEQQQAEQYQAEQQQAAPEQQQAEQYQAFQSPWQPVADQGSPAQYQPEGYQTQYQQRPVFGQGQQSYSQPEPTTGQAHQPRSGHPLPQRRPKAVPPREAPDPVATAGGTGQWRPSAAENTAYTAVERGTLPQPEFFAEHPAPTPRREPLEADETGQIPRWEADTAYPQREPESPQPAPSAATGQESPWSFATDETWRTVQAVSQAAPSSFTSAGLPRRRRGEQLLPGAASTAPASAGLPQRDAQDVRGRLSSFQQGVRRGRHRTTQAVDSERETMEGE